MVRRRSSLKHKRQRMRSTSPLPRRNGATRLKHRVSSSTSRLSTSLLPFRESLPTRKHGPTKKISLSSCPETNARSAQIRKLRVISSKPLDASSGPRTGAGLRRGGTSSFRLIVLAIAIAQLAAANLHYVVRCIDCTASQMIFFDSHFFALRFAVGSQCPKFDSQTAMRYRVNYSLSQNVSTNIGRRFRTLISKHFSRNSKLSKIFNINTLKLSYSYMPNMAAVISPHNSSILRGGRTIGENYAGGRRCNCRVKEDCSLNGTCQVPSVVYKATITTTSEEGDYTGLIVQTFKLRYNAHQHSMRDSRYRHSISLSKHVWALKDEHVSYNIQWSVLWKAKDYQNTTKRCNLCLAEKLEIIMANKERSLNRSSELISKCRHETKFYLSSFQPQVS